MVDIQEEICIRIVVRERIEVTEPLVVTVHLHQLGQNGDELSLGMVLLGA